MIASNAQESLLDRLGKAEHEAIQCIPLPELKIGPRRISAELQRRLLGVLLNHAEDDGVCRLYLPAIAEQASLAPSTARVGIHAMHRANLVWVTRGTTLAARVQRGVRWDTIAELMPAQDVELPDTTYRAHQDSLGARERLLGRYKLAATKLIVENLALRTLDDGWKPISCELQRQVLEVLCGYEPSTCPLDCAQLAAEIQRHGVSVSQRSIRRTCNALTRQKVIWQAAMFRTDGSPSRFIRWDMLGQAIPARHTWHCMPPEPTSLARKMQSAKRKLVNAHGKNAELLIDLLELRPASSGTTIVSASAQREVLRAIARHNFCKMTCADISAQVELCLRTVQHAIGALIGQRLVSEHAIGNTRVRVACWTAFPLFLPKIPEREPVETKDVDLQNGQIMVDDWLGAVPERKAKKRNVPTLRAVFDRHVLPQLTKRKRSPKTIRDIALAIDTWEQMWPEETHNVRAIRAAHLDEWQEHLLARGLSHSRVNAYMRNIRQVLLSAFKHGLVKKRCEIPMLPEAPAAKFYFSFAEVASLWRACDALTWPELPGLSSAEWWRCAIVLYWTYGFRTQELIAFGVGMEALSWASITLERTTPNVAGLAESELGWLTYTPQKQKWAKPQPLHLPLTATARSAIDRLATSEHSADTPLFPWPKSGRDFYREWHKLQRIADVHTKAGGHYGLKAFRKSAATYLERHQKGLGAAVCGWADRETGSIVMSRHYESNELMLVEQLADYQVPTCFSSL